MPFFFLLLRGKNPAFQWIYRKDCSHSLSPTLTSNTLYHQRFPVYIWYHRGVLNPRSRYIIKFNVFILEQRPDWQHSEAKALIYTTDKVSMQKLRRLGGSLSYYSISVNFASIRPLRIRLIFSVYFVCAMNAQDVTLPLNHWCKTTFPFLLLIKISVKVILQVTSDVFQIISNDHCLTAIFVIHCFIF